MAARDLRRARAARRRLRAAGWVTVADGALITLTALLLAPFLFPFALAAGALAMLAGWQLVRLRGALGAVLAAGATLLVAGAAAAEASASAAALLALGLAALMGGGGAAVLALVYLDAGHLPTARGIEND